MRFDDGTFAAAAPDAWGSPSTGILEDIRRAIEMTKRLTPKPVLRVVEVPAHWFPVRAPRLERERFSGGVNLSAQARNDALRAAARGEQEESCFVSEALGAVYCAPKVAAELRKLSPAPGVLFTVGDAPARYELTPFEVFEGESSSLTSALVQRAVQNITYRADRAAICRIITGVE